MKLHSATVDLLCAKAEPYYNPSQPYHNWLHAEAVMRDSLVLLNSSGRWTRHVNRGLLQIAAAWHDAGHDHQDAAHFETKEHYAVHLTMEALKRDLPLRQRKEIAEMILGTRYKAHRASMDAIALHYGDVYNMGLPYDEFCSHTDRLWQEYGSPPWQEFWQTAAEVIAQTITEGDRELPRIGVDDEKWLSQAQQNLIRMQQERAGEGR
jgi:hypothetical protein